MAWEALSVETKITVLLTTRIGQLQDKFKPLSPSAFRTLQAWLKDRSLSIGDLFHGEHPSIAEDLAKDDIVIPPIPLLLESMPTLMQALDYWSGMGIWVVGETDPEFPVRLAQRLQNTALPLLFGAGPVEGLGRGGVCVVGSRDSSDEGCRFAVTLAKRCSAEDITVISSDMRGVDRRAISAALETGGRAICILSNSLEKAVVTKRHRDYIRSGYLTLVTPFSPDARFRVANAMRANRYQYCLSDFAVMVESRREGGVWLGAEENRKERWVPSFVRQGTDNPLGNQALLSLGLMPLEDHNLENPEVIREYFAHRIATNGIGQQEVHGQRKAGDEFFKLFCEQLVGAMAAGLGTKSQIQKFMGIETSQFDAWIGRALNEGLVCSKDDGESLETIKQKKRRN